MLKKKTTKKNLIDCDLKLLKILNIENILFQNSKPHMGGVNPQQLKLALLIP